MYLFLWLCFICAFFF